MLNDITFAIVGVMWALVFADAALTLHGLSSGKLSEKNRLVRWFVKSPWRLYPLTIGLCAIVFFSVRIISSSISWVGIAMLVPAIALRAKVVVNNYRLNVKAW